jgi:glycosyltransferase involved in cell wall biosynthesis
MTNFSKVIIWQPTLTDHQAFTFEAMAEISKLTIKTNLIKEQDRERSLQGWTNTDLKSVQKKIIPKYFFMIYCLKELIKHANQIHIFCNSFSDYRLYFILFLASLFRLKVFIISEPYSVSHYGYFFEEASWKSQLKTKLRPLLYFFYILLIKKGLSGVFAISDLAKDQFLKAGLSNDKIYAFGYFVPSVQVISINSIKRNNCLRIVFVGNLIQRKGIESLLNAFNNLKLKGVPVELYVYGYGNPSVYCFNQKGVFYMGEIPFGNTQYEISKYDVLVLPSFFDGWGVVVNEAICAGLPVICSDMVGAKILIRNFSCGYVFKAGDEKNLINIINKLSNNRNLLKNLQKNTIIASSKIQPKIAAQYLLDIISNNNTSHNFSFFK